MLLILSLYFENLVPNFFTGYLPQNLDSLDSSYGSQNQLETLLQKMRHNKIRAMADIVINHRVGTTQGHGGMYNRYDGIPYPWDENAVTSCSGGLVILFIPIILVLVLQNFTLK